MTGPPSPWVGVSDPFPADSVSAVFERAAFVARCRARARFLHWWASSPERGLWVPSAAAESLVVPEPVSWSLAPVVVRVGVQFRPVWKPEPTGLDAPSSLG